MNDLQTFENLLATLKINHNLTKQDATIHCDDGRKFEVSYTLRIGCGIGEHGYHVNFFFDTNGKFITHSVAI